MLTKNTFLTKMNQQKDLTFSEENKIDKIKEFEINLLRFEYKNAGTNILLNRTDINNKS